MDTLALNLVNKCYETQDPHLELGRCGLRDEDFAVGSRLDIALRRCTHLEKFVLSDTWNEWNEKNKAQHGRISSNKGEFNFFSAHPPALLELTKLSNLVCAGNTDNRWKISDQVLQAIGNLKNLVSLNIAFNQISELKGLESLDALQKLDISSNQISEIKGLETLTALQIIDISGNQISELKGLETLTALQVLYVFQNQISEIKGLEALTALQKLSISDNRISELKGLEPLTALQTIDIFTNQISEIKGLKSLSDLQELNIYDNKISEIKGLESLTALKTLNIHLNQISEIKGLESLNALQNLYISHNQISEIKGLEALITLQNLSISHNQISEIKGLEALITLQNLSISHNQISEIKGLEALITLRELFISENQISELKGLESHTALKGLYISQNQISELKRLESLKALKKFDISRNQISELKGLKPLTALQNLYISNNQITELKELEPLTALQTLDISHNKITELKGLESLTALKGLNISNNNVSDITPLIQPFLQRADSPLQIVIKEPYAMRLGEINVNGNPLSIPPMEFAQQGNDAIIYWFKAKDQGIIINQEAKIILFGNGRGGKTTLSCRLRKNEFVALTEYKQTHGILIETWRIPEKDFPEALKEKINNHLLEHNTKSPLSIDEPECLKLHLWDFGGQEYYHATHRLFMTNNTLYLLLWEKATNYQDEDKGYYPLNYWQKNINHYSTKNVTLRIQNKVTNGAESTDGLNYKIAFCNPDDEDSLAEYELDIKKLKKAISSQLSNLSYLGEPFPKVYDDIREALRKEQRPFIRYDDYKVICQEVDTTASRIMQVEQQMETLIRFLDDTGAAICFRFRKGVQNESLRKYVFTDPSWLTKIIYEILEKELPEFGQQHVETVVARHGLDALVWIEIMKQFELIFEIERKEEKKYIVPQYLPLVYKNQEALEMAVEGKKMEHAFTLNYPEFLPKSNFLRLLSKYGKQNVRYLYWKRGILFFVNGKTVFAGCIDEPNERKIVIEIQDRDEHVTKEIFETLLAIDDTEDLQISVNEKGFVNVKKLKEKIFNNNTEIETAAGHTLPVGEFNILFEKKGSEIAVEEKIRTKNELDATTTKGTKPEIFFSYAWGEEREKIVNDLYDSLAADNEYILMRDKKDVDYKDSILSFMKNIGKGNFVIVALSEKYIESEYCMFELNELYKNSNQDFKELLKKIFPIRVESLSLNDPESLNKYIEFWKEKEEKWRKFVSENPTDVGISQHKEYRKIKAIKENVGDLLNGLHYINTLTNELLSANDFAKIKGAIKKRAKEL